MIIAFNFIDNTFMKLHCTLNEDASFRPGGGGTGGRFTEFTDEI